LADGIHRLDRGAESPLLLDPSDPSIDPLDHLRWMPVDRTYHPRQWQWELQWMSEEGRVTAKILLLDARSADVRNRFQKMVWPRFHAEIERQLDRKSSIQLNHAWTKLTTELIDRTDDLAAATWSMLDILRTSTAALRKAKLAAPARP
jgi:hypothetical protein